MSTVKAAVRRDPDVRTVDVVIFVSGGIVTLSGPVSTSHQRSRAEQLASEVEGVTAVVNEIVVSNGGPGHHIGPFGKVREGHGLFHRVKQGHCRQLPVKPMFLARYPSTVLLIVLLSLAAAVEARSQELLREEEKKSNSRFKYNLGLYKPSYGIYDEILERTEPGPESLREVLKLPSWLIVGGQQCTRYETLNGR